MAVVFVLSEFAGFGGGEPLILKVPELFCVQTLMPFSRFPPRSWLQISFQQNIIYRGANLTRTDIEVNSANTGSQTRHRYSFDVIRDRAPGVIAR